MALTQALGLLWLIVGIGYFLMWQVTPLPPQSLSSSWHTFLQDNQMLKKVEKGISTIVIMSLPVTLFESLYTINLLSVNFKLIGTISLAKLCMWFVGAAIG